MMTPHAPPRTSETIDTKSEVPAAYVRIANVPARRSPWQLVTNFVPPNAQHIRTAPNYSVEIFGRTIASFESKSIPPYIVSEITNPDEAAMRQWHALIDTQFERELTPYERMLLHKLETGIVARLGAAELEVKGPKLDARVKRHEQVIAMLEQLAELLEDSVK